MYDYQHMCSICAHTASSCCFLHTDFPSLLAQIMILLCNQQSFICTHVDFCHPRCYQHHSRSCARLVRAIKLVYGETVDSLREDSTSSGNIGARAKKNKEVSFTNRNWPALHWISKNKMWEGWVCFFCLVVYAKCLCFQCSDKSCLRTPSMKRRPTDTNTEGKKDTGMLKYIRNQVITVTLCARGKSNSKLFRLNNCTLK